LVTAGPTYEPIDPVRFIGNHSSGKMGVAIAEELARRGAAVDLVLGPVNYNGHNPAIQLHKVQTAAEMYAACEQLFERSDIAVMSAAVADYRPASAAPEKIKKKDENLTLELVKTQDILASLGARKRQNQVLAGFALETTQERKNALEKMEKKNADLIVLNSLNDEGAGFGVDTNKITIFGRGGEEWAFDQKSKTEVAKDIVDRILKLL